MKWQDHGVGAGSVLFADGRLYIHGEEGEVGMVEANSEAYQERDVSSHRIPPTHKMGKAWAYPALADGRLYIFDFGTLWCYDVKGQAAGRRSGTALMAIHAARVTVADVRRR